MFILFLRLFFSCFLVVFSFASKRQNKWILSISCFKFLILVNLTSSDKNFKCSQLYLLVLSFKLSRFHASKGLPHCKINIFFHYVCICVFEKTLFFNSTGIYFCVCYQVEILTLFSKEVTNYSNTLYRQNIFFSSIDMKCSFVRKYVILKSMLRLRIFVLWSSAPCGLILKIMHTF